jgi:hypothetical protein
MDALADDAAPAERRGMTALAVVLSVVLHVGVLVFLRVAVSHERKRTVTVIDIDVAPMAPKAEALPPEEPVQPEEPAAAATDETAAGENDVPEPPEATGEGMGGVDAGVEMDAAPEPVDAGVPVDARRRRPDAGAADAGEEMLADVADAGVAGDGGAGAGAAVVAAADDGDGGVVVVTDDGDGGVVAATTTPGDGDAGTGTGTGTGTGSEDGGLVAMGSDGGVGVPGADLVGTPGARPSSGTNANLLSYFPSGHVITVMVRFDRLRDTEWGERIDTMMMPLPDYKALAGDTKVRMSDLFDLFVISSATPDDVTATTLVGRSRITSPEMRDYIDQPDAPVKWTPVKGGALGTRGRSARVLPGDPRVFLMWAPKWIVMAAPRDLAGLTTARPGSLDAAVRPADLPPWLARAGTIADESGEPDGPAIMLTVANMFGSSIPLMGAGGASIPAPEQATLTLEVVPKGFLVRGNLRYADESAAATAHDAIARLRVEMLDQYGSVPLLGGMPLLTVLRGLDLQRTGRRLAFASSASIADARGLIELAGSLVKSHFEENERRLEEHRQRQRQAPKPKAPAAPKPKTPAPKPP